MYAAIRKSVALLVRSMGWQRRCEVMGKVLVVDDEPQIHQVLSSILEQDHHVVSHASGVSQAREAIRNGQFEVILTAQKLSDGDGVDVLAAAHEADASVSVIMVAGTELPTPSVLHEAADLVAAPYTPEVVRTAVHRACRRTELLRQNAQLKAEIDRLKDSLEIAQTAHNGGNGNGKKVDVGWIEALPSSFDLRGLLATLEKSLIERTLQSTGGAQAEAARRLGLSRSDLSYKLLKYELRKETTAAS